MAIPLLTRLRLALLLCLLLPALGAQAQQLDAGDYVVHYSAVNTTFLTPDIAQAYGIVRSARRGFLNIAVRRKLPGGGTEAVTAAVSGAKDNLLGQGEPLEFREIREGEAVYYIAEFEFSNAENLRFSLDILPEGARAPIPLRWSARMYVN